MKIDETGLADSSMPATAKEKRPGPGRPTREQAEQRKLELLEVALDLFAENGFEGTTIENIARTVGMAKRTVYTLYNDKLSLFKSSLEHAIEQWIVPVDKLRAAETDDLQESLINIGGILVDNILTPQGIRLLRISNAESNRMPEISAYNYEVGSRPTLDFLKELFRRRLQLTAQKAEDAATAFLYLVVGGPANSTAWGVELDRRFVTRQTQYFVHVLLHGLLPR